MKVTDKKIKASLRTEAAPSEETVSMLLDRLGNSEEEGGNRKMNTSIALTDRRGLFRGRQGLAVSLMALAAVAVIAFVIIKLIPTLSSPVAENRTEPGITSDHQEPGVVPENEQEPGGVWESEPIDDPEKEKPAEDTYLKVPIRPEELRWGMTEEEVIEILGEPAERNVSLSGVSLVYDQPLETPLGTCTDLRLLFDPAGVRLSEEKTVPLGLNYVRAGFLEMTEEEFSKRLADLYGDYDEIRELEYPLELLGLASGIRYILYEWDAWKLGSLPDLKKRFYQLQDTVFSYQEKKGIPTGTKQTVSDDDMVLEIRLACNEDPEAGEMADPGPDNEAETVQESGVSVTFDAGRYLLAVMPEKVWTYENEDYSFTMPEFWQKQGVSMGVEKSDSGSELLVVRYRGLELCQFSTVPEDMTGSGDPLFYDAADWNFGDGRKLVLSVNNSAYRIYSDGSVRMSCFEPLPEPAYPSDEELSDILYVLTGEEQDVRKIKAMAGSGDKDAEYAGNAAIATAMAFIKEQVVPCVRLKNSADADDGTVDGADAEDPDGRADLNALIPAQYAAENYRFTMPDLWADKGAGFTSDGNEMNVMYRGVKLCTVLEAPAEEIEQRAEEYPYITCADTDDGNVIAMWVWGEQVLSEIYTDGTVTGIDENGDPFTYTSEEDLSDILHMFLKGEADIGKLTGQAEGSDPERYLNALTIKCNTFVNSDVLMKLRGFSKESKSYTSNDYQPFDPDAPKSTWLTELLDTEPFSYEDLPNTVEDCQIPEDMLQEMTDRELLLAVLDYPYYDYPQLPFIFDGQYYRDWGDSAAESFNGFRELTQERDSYTIQMLLNQCSAHIQKEYGPLQPRELLQLLNNISTYMQWLPVFSD